VDKRKGWADREMDRADDLVRRDPRRTGASARARHAPVETILSSSKRDRASRDLEHGATEKLLASFFHRGATDRKVDATAIRLDAAETRLDAGAIRLDAEEIGIGAPDQTIPSS